MNRSQGVTISDRMEFQGFGAGTGGTGNFQTGLLVGRAIIQPFVCWESLVVKLDAATQICRLAPNGP